MAAEALHDSLLSIALDSLGHELEPERLPQAYDSLEECEVGGAAVDLGREAAVDLDDVDRETLKIGERCVTRAEVVEGELDASVLQGGELLLGPLAACDEHALGQLERQQVRGQVGALECVVDVIHELRMLKLPRGDVDRDLEVATEQLAQAGGVEAGLEQDPASDLHDQP